MNTDIINFLKKLKNIKNSNNWCHFLYMCIYTGGRGTSGVNKWGDGVGDGGRG